MVLALGCNTRREMLGCAVVFRHEHFIGSRPLDQPHVRAASTKTSDPPTPPGLVVARCSAGRGGIGWKGKARAWGLGFSFPPPGLATDSFPPHAKTSDETSAHTLIHDRQTPPRLPLHRHHQRYVALPASCRLQGQHYRDLWPSRLPLRGGTLTASFSI